MKEFANSRKSQILLLKLDISVGPYKQNSTRTLNIGFISLALFSSHFWN